MKIKFLILILLIFSCLGSIAFSKTQKEEYQNDYLYSEEYFNYIIEQASIERQLEEDKRKEEARISKKAKQNKDEEIKISTEEIEIEEENEEDIITDDFAPFKLRITQDRLQPKYSESFKKVDSKTTIPIGENLSFFHNMTTTRNKYNSNDYKILAGSEYTLGKYIGISGGLETNFRGLDQNPTSKKLYITPSVKLTDKVTLSFINKYNPHNGSSDHDLSLRISPLKSKAFDFGVYSSATRHQNGRLDKSVNFSTNFYFK